MREFRLADGVYFFSLSSSEPDCPPEGENWLVPREGYKGNSVFFYLEQTGEILYAQTLISHADMYAEIPRSPHYDSWLRGYVVGSIVWGRYAKKRLGDPKYIGPRVVKLTGARYQMGTIRSLLRRFRSLRAIPGDYKLLRRRNPLGRIEDWW